MSEDISLAVRLPNQKIQDCTLAIQGGPPWSLKLHGLGLEMSAFTGSDLFEALCDLRQALEGMRIQALCAGAQVNVYPSGMSRSMSGGRKAYVLKEGVRSSDLVDIFERGDALFCGSVADQKAFYQTWVRSLSR